MNSQLSIKGMNVLNLVRPSILKLKPYASAKDEFKDFEQDLIYLDANENPYNNGFNRYPDPHQLRLKQKIAAIKGVKEPNILLGNGSDEILDIIFRVFFEPGKDNIIINVPTFGMFEVLANLNNIQYKKIMLDERFDIQPHKIIEAIDEQTKAVFICSPNNPTGNLMKEEHIMALLEKELLVVIDEAYIDFAKADSWIKKIERFPNLIVSQTFSKAYGMAGLRLGACYAASEVIEVLKKVKMPYNVNILTQQKVMTYLDQQHNFNAEVDQIIASRDWLIKQLKSISLVEKIYPSNSNFLLVKVDDANKRYTELIARDLVVRNRSNQPLCSNCLRFTVGTPAENKKLIKALRNLDQKTI